MADKGIRTTAEIGRARERHWFETAEGQPRGYIQPDSLRELWFHTGTKCNLGCWFCLEGSGPKSNRIELLTLEGARPFFSEAIKMGVEQFSFTGGEPFVNPEFTQILSLALDHRPCLVLTNGTKPLRDHLEEVKRLADKAQAVRFRISLDFPDPDRHDKTRGRGNFMMALESAALLHRLGFGVSIARHADESSGSAREIDLKFLPFFREAGLPEDTNIVSFPEFLGPGADREVPSITENCMTTYKDEKSRADFMCNYSKMIVTRNGQTTVYACTLVDDDHEYDLGGSLVEAMKERIMMKHHRCYSCFADQASCSEL